MVRGLSLALLVLLGCGRGPGKAEAVSGALADLAGARPGEGRLSVLSWAPYTPGSETPQLSVGFRKAAKLAGDALAANRTAETLRNDAIVALLAKDSDRSISELAEATEIAPRDATLWSDLAAAHLQRGTGLADPYDLVLALAAADHAVEIDPLLLPARFNRGLAYEHLSLRRVAAADWQTLTRKESDPGWLREAVAHASAPAETAVGADWTSDLKAVEEEAGQGDLLRVRSIVRGSPQRFREHIEGRVLPAWATQSGMAAKRSLAMARAVGQALVANQGDPMIAETVDQIDHFEAADPESLRRLGRAFQAYGEGISLSQREAYSQALPRFDAAQKELSRLGSPFAGWATFQAAYCQDRLFDFPQARARLAALLRELETGKYRALHGRALWVLALIDAVEGSLTASLTHLDSALADFQSLDEKPNIAWLRAFVAVDFNYLGKSAEAWRRLYPALQELESLDKPQAQMVVWHAAASLSREQDRLEIARAFVNELLRSAKATGQASAIVEALRWHATILARLGKKEEAARDLKEAWSYQQRISDPRSQRSLEGDLRLAEAELVGAVSPEQAIAALDSSIRILRINAYHYQLGQALYLRSRVEASLGRFDDEEHDLSEAIAESERQREKVLAPEERISYFDRTREMIDTMISFQLERRRDPAAALRFSEQAKARVLRDWILTQPESGPDPSHIDETRLTFAGSTPLLVSLPEKTAVIEYALLPQSTVIWILRPGTRPKVATVKGGKDVLEDLAQKLHRALLNGRAAVFDDISAKLYDLLLGPVAGDFYLGERLVFVPDRALHALPFASLRNPRTGRYLVQDYVFSVAPSIRILSADRRRATPASPRALMIADPDFDLGLYPSLPRLRSEEAEVAVNRSFPDSLVLRGRDATRRAFLRSAGDFEIVHFGGHSIVNTDFPLLSQMVLAPEAGDPDRGVLYSGDILRQRFPRTRLVVLASCSTAAGRISSTEGVENLARPFLAAGVPAVIASLWDVDDKMTAKFFAKFYENFQKGWDVAGALRSTQIDFIKHGSGPSASPRVWATFEVIGTSVPERKARAADPPPLPRARPPGANPHLHPPE
ncbi:MAG: CHAT domain-containing protein [Thermoanaerobaculia bacterium]